MRTFLQTNLATLAGFVLGVVTVVCMLGPSFVLGTSSFWDYPPTDFNSHLIGYRMYVLDDWGFPLFHTGTLEEPRGLNLLFMDALPIVALPAKLLAPIVPSFARTLWFNPFGGWLALSYGLQGAFGARLMREIVGRAGIVAELSGAAFAVATPVFVLRFLHIALSSHFFILAALLLYVQSERGLSVRRAATRWTALFAALTLVHPYLFAMCAGIFAAAMATMAARRRFRDALVVAAAAISTVLVIVAVAGFHGSEVSKGGMWGYGYKMTDLISFITPQWATFFPFAHAHRIDMTRSEASEGWAYLGAGVLLATVMALVKAPREAARALRKHWILALALALMAAFAISHRITLGEKVLVELPLPKLLDWPTRQFRSCGRFIWPAIYAGSFYVLALVFRATRGTRLALAVPLVAAIQYVDTLAALLYVGSYTSRGEARFLEWDAMNPVVADHKGITLAPTFDCISWERPIVTFAQMEVEFMAATRGIGLSSVRSSRPLRDCRREPADHARARVVPDRLYLGFPPEVPRSTAIHFERGGAACAAFRHGMACSTRFVSNVPQGFEPFSPDVDYTLGHIIAVGRRSDERYLGVGWSWPEESHRWTDGAAAFVYLRATEPLPQGARVHLRAAGAVLEERPRMSALVRINGVLVGEVKLTSESQSIDLTVPDALTGERLLELELEPSDYRAPAVFGKSTEQRALGISVTELAIRP
jgi:hypothetical protein